MPFRLLLLENDPALLRDLASAADRAGLGRRFRGVEKAAEALSKVAREHPDVVLLDLASAEAFEFLEGLSHRDAPRREILVGLASRHRDDAVERAYALGINSCLLRPDSAAEQSALFRAIRQYWEVLNVRPDPFLPRCRK